MSTVDPSPFTVEELDLLLEWHAAQPPSSSRAELVRRLEALRPLLEAAE